MRQTITRNHTGHRTGADHQNAKADDETVSMVRKLNQAGLGYRYLARINNLPVATVRDWCTYRTRWAA